MGWRDYFTSGKSDASASGKTKDAGSSGGSGSTVEHNYKVGDHIYKLSTDAEGKMTLTADREFVLPQGTQFQHGVINTTDQKEIEDLLREHGQLPTVSEPTPEPEPAAGDSSPEPGPAGGASATPTAPRSSWERLTEWASNVSWEGLKESLSYESYKAKADQASKNSPTQAALAENDREMDRTEGIESDPSSPPWLPHLEQRLEIMDDDPAGWIKVDPTEPPPGLTGEAPPVPGDFDSNKVPGLRGLEGAVAERDTSRDGDPMAIPGRDAVVSDVTPRDTPRPTKYGQPSTEGGAPPSALDPSGSGTNDGGQTGRSGAGGAELDGSLGRSTTAPTGTTESGSSGGSSVSGNVELGEPIIEDGPPADEMPAGENLDFGADVVDDDFDMATSGDPMGERRKPSAEEMQRAAEMAEWRHGNRTSIDPVRDGYDVPAADGELPMIPDLTNPGPDGFVGPPPGATPDRPEFGADPRHTDPMPLDDGPYEAGDFEPGEFLPDPFEAALGHGTVADPTADRAPADEVPPDTGTVARPSAEYDLRFGSGSTQVPSSALPRTTTNDVEAELLDGPHQHALGDPVSGGGGYAPPPEPDPETDLATVLGEQPDSGMVTPVLGDGGARLREALESTAAEEPVD